MIIYDDNLFLIYDYNLFWSMRVTYDKSMTITLLWSTIIPPFDYLKPEQCSRPGDLWHFLRHLGRFAPGCHETLAASTGEAALASDRCQAFAPPGLGTAVDVERWKMVEASLIHLMMLRRWMWKTWKIYRILETLLFVLLLEKIWWIFFLEMTEERWQS